MLFLPITFAVVLVIIGVKFLAKLDPKASGAPEALKRLLQRIKLKAKLLTPGARQQIQDGANGSGNGNAKSGVLQTATKNGPKSGILKQVHFAEVIATSSGDSNSTTTISDKQNNTQAGKVVGKNGGKNGGGKPNGKSNGEQSKGGKKDNSIPEIEEFDIDSLVDVTTNYSVISRANLVKKQQQQHQLNKKLGRKRHNSEGSKPNYSSEQLFKMIAASCLSKEEVEIAVETLLNKLESGEAQWNQPKNDPLLKLRNQLRESEAALTTESHNHEQARARLAELKQQLQTERSSKAQAAEEAASVKKECALINAALERARNELSNQRSLQQRAEEEKMGLIAKLEQENAQLQSLLVNQSKGEDAQCLRHELDDKLERLHRYELANESLSQNNQELEKRLHSAELQLSEIEANKRSDDYEACAKIAELESNRVALEKALQDHMARLNDVLAANSMLEKSLNDARVLNNQQEEMIKRLHEERQMGEASMKRALCEMETELRALHEQLSNKTAASDERYRKELDQFEKELNDAGQREQRLTVEMRELRDGLSELFPDLKAKLVQVNSDDWVHQYLQALKQLTTTVDQLRRTQNNNHLTGEKHENGSDCSNQSSPSKRSGIDKSTLTLSTTLGRSSRVGSPISNGRSSRASSTYDREKRLMETKLVEFNSYVTQLENKIRALELSASTVDHQLVPSEPQVVELRQQQQQSAGVARLKHDSDSIRLEQQDATRQLNQQEELCH